MSNLIDVAADLRRELSRILDSKHFDSRQEMDESVELLRRALASGITAETLKSKLHDLKRARSGDNFDIKLSTAIRDYYWERTYTAGDEIPFKPFRP